ncbi:hypothetical protein JST97_06750 [bacterium]|nr:hypothetical protein [bacterium]
MMKKWFGALLLTAGLVLGASAEGTLTVFCNSVPVKLNAITRNGVAYYPVEPVVNAFGADMYWNPTVHSLRVDRKNIEIEPVFVGEDIYLPLETIAEALGASATWNPGQGEVVLNRTKRLNAPNNVPMVSFQGSHIPEDATGGGHTKSNLQPPPSVPVRPAPGQPDPIGAQRVSSELNREKEGSGDIYTPRVARNAAFQVTVTNLEVVDSIRGHHQPRNGHRFIVIYVSQKNVTMQPVLNPGTFFVQDQSGNDFEPMMEFSNFMGVVLKPYGINFGYFVYELPTQSVPVRLVLVTTNQSPVEVNL